MSKATIVKKVTEVHVENSIILSVEAGNINKNVDNPVIAFTTDATIDGKNVKAIVKGAMAITLYHYFFKDGRSRCKVHEGYENAFDVYKSVFISFIGEHKENRKNEVVVENINNVKFNYEYTVAECN